MFLRPHPHMIRGADRHFKHPYPTSEPMVRAVADVSPWSDIAMDQSWDEGGGHDLKLGMRRAQR